MCNDALPTSDIDTKFEPIYRSDNYLFKLISFYFGFNKLIST